VSVFWRHSFGSAPIDEVRLASEAAEILAAHTFAADQPGNVLGLCDTLDANTATAVLYQYLVGTRHREFVADVDARPASGFDVQGKTKLLVVPGFFYKEHPDIGSGGEVMLATGAACGFEVGRVPLRSLGTISENANILKETLKTEVHPDVWLVSFSKGAAEVRLLMQQMGESFPTNVRGWLSLSGIIGGTPLATAKFRSAFHRIASKTFFPLLGTSAGAIHEMRHDHEFWQRELVLPHNMRCVHVAGVPLVSHVQPILVKRYQQLSEYGVNDGMSLLRSTMAVPGDIYPIWGTDHMLRTPALSPLIYRLLNFAANCG
jgi:hypothetical protein